MENPHQEMNNISCHACHGDDVVKLFDVTDYFLTAESFEIHGCSRCGLLMTLPQPSAELLPSYYQSKEYLSHNNKSNSLFEGLYRAARLIMNRSKVSILNRYSQIGTVLDIGCGTGEFLAACKKKRWNSFGIEPNKAARQYAISKHGLQIFDESFLFQSQAGSFDVVTMWHSFEHTRNPQTYLTVISKILKPDGVLLLALPNHNSWDAKYYGKFWAAWDVPRHLFHFSEKAIKIFSENNGFTFVDVLPLKLDAYYVSLLSEKYRNGNKNYLKAMAIGCRSNKEAKEQNIGFSSQIYLFSKT